MRPGAARSPARWWRRPSSSTPIAFPTASTIPRCSTRKRAKFLYVRIRATAIVGVGIADVKRIDRLNILHATMWAMAQAVAQLPQTPKLVAIDGNRAPDLKCPSRTVVKGDARCLSIAAASIIAKVTRDRLMVQLGRQASRLRLRAAQGLRHRRAP